MPDVLTEIEQWFEEVGHDIEVLIFGQGGGGGGGPPPPPPVLTTLTVTPTSTTVAQNGSDIMEVTALDQSGNPMGNVTGTLTEGGTALSGGIFTTNALGKAAVSVNFPTAGNISIGATSGSVTATPVTITVTPSGPPPPQVLTTLQVVQGSGGDVVAGGSLTYTITGLDQNGQPMQTGVPVQLDSNGVPISGASGTTSNGVVAILVTWPTAGTFVVTATSGGVTSSPVTTTVTPQPPPSNVLSVVISGPTTSTNNAYVQYQALVTVQAGTVGTGITSSWYLDGVDVYDGTTGPGPGPANEYTAYWGKGVPTGTHTVQAKVSGVASNTITLVVS